MKCRHCQTPLEHRVVDLGTAPPSNAYLRAADLDAPERHYPLKVYVCHACWLVQTWDYAEAEHLFNADYAYFSSVSQSWLDHCADFVSTSAGRFDLGADSMVVEIAANDGYLLQYVKARGIPCLGVEPTAAAAAVARGKGLDIREVFFGETSGTALASEGFSADLMVANNVLAHVTDINDFLRGFTALLKPGGVASFEFPHLLNLIRLNQFDTIYHEHFSYLSLTALDRIFAANGLALFDVERLPTHGGSLRCFVQRADTGRHPRSAAVETLLAEETAAGMNTLAFYAGLQSAAERIKDDFVLYLIEAKRAGLRVAGYGAAAKGNTLMNFAGIRPDLLAFVIDNNPAKQGKFLPGSRIPIVSRDRLETEKVDRLVIFPWNIATEIAGDLAGRSGWAGTCVTFVPEMREFAPNGV